MSVLGAGDLGKCRGHRELLQVREARSLPVGPWLDDPLGRILVGPSLTAGGLEVPPEQSLGHSLVGETFDPPTCARIAVLEQPRVHAVEPGTRDDASPPAIATVLANR